MKHCCEELSFILDEDRTAIGYYEQYREYQLHIRNSDAVYNLIFCPWCGKKLPESLRGAFFDLIETELGMDDYDPDKLPEEFKTDEWWKKRGL